jgi:hypothetical protein
VCGKTYLRSLRVQGLLIIGGVIIAIAVVGDFLSRNPIFLIILGLAIAVPILRSIIKTLDNRQKRPRRTSDDKLAAQALRELRLLEAAEPINAPSTPTDISDTAKRIAVTLRGKS